MSTGEAAHIRAAAPGGPRYDPTQSPEERSSILNGIWACSNCADRIDKDYLAYPPEKLLSLKADAECSAADRQGKPLVVLPNAPHSMREISRSIRIFCLSEEARIEQLDPRFHVSVAWAGSGPVYELRAAGQDVHASLELADSSLGLHKTLNEFFGYGGKLLLRDIQARMTGSPIFDHVGSVLTKLEMSSKEKDVGVTMEVDDSTDSALLVDLVGTVSSGIAGIKIKATSFSGMISIEVTRDHGAGDAQLKLFIDLGRWERQPVGELPYFLQLSRFIRAIDRKTTLRLHLTGDGRQQLFSKTVLERQDLARYSAAIVRRLEYYRLLEGIFKVGVVAPSPINQVLEDLTDSTMKALRFLLVGSGAADTSIEVNIVPPDTLEAFFEAFSAETVPDFIYHEMIGFELDGTRFGPFDTLFSCPAVYPKIKRRVPRKKDGTIRMSFRPVAGKRWTISRAENTE